MQDALVVENRDHHRVRRTERRLATRHAEIHRERLSALEHLVVEDRHRDRLAQHVGPEGQRVVRARVIRALQRAAVGGGERHRHRAVARAGARHRQRHAARALDHVRARDRELQRAVVIENRDRRERVGPERRLARRNPQAHREGLRRLDHFVVQNRDDDVGAGLVRAERQGRIRHRHEVRTGERRAVRRAVIHGERTVQVARANDRQRDRQLRFRNRRRRRTELHRAVVIGDGHRRHGRRAQRGLARRGREADREGFRRLHNGVVEDGDRDDLTDHVRAEGDQTIHDARVIRAGQRRAVGRVVEHRRHAVRVARARDGERDRAHGLDHTRDRRAELERAVVVENRHRRERVRAKRRLAALHRQPDGEGLGRLHHRVIDDDISDRERGDVRAERNHRIVHRDEIRAGQRRTVRRAVGHIHAAREVARAGHRRHDREQAFVNTHRVRVELDRAVVIQNRHRHAARRANRRFAHRRSQADRERFRRLDDRVVQDRKHDVRAALVGAKRQHRVRHTREVRTGDRRAVGRAVRHRGDAVQVARARDRQRDRAEALDDGHRVRAELERAVVVVDRDHRVGLRAQRDADRVAEDEVKVLVTFHQFVRQDRERDREVRHPGEERQRPVGRDVIETRGCREIRGHEINRANRARTTRAADRQRERRRAFEHRDRRRGQLHHPVIAVESRDVSAINAIDRHEITREPDVALRLARHRLHRGVRTETRIEARIQRTIGIDARNRTAGRPVERHEVAANDHATTAVERHRAHRAARTRADVERVVRRAIDVHPHQVGVAPAIHRAEAATDHREAVRLQRDRVHLAARRQHRRVRHIAAAVAVQAREAVVRDAIHTGKHAAEQNLLIGLRLDREHRAIRTRRARRERRVGDTIRRESRHIRAAERIHPGEIAANNHRAIAQQLDREHDPIRSEARTKRHVTRAVRIQPRQISLREAHRILERAADHDLAVGLQRERINNVVKAETRIERRVERAIHIHAGDAVDRHALVAREVAADEHPAIGLHDERVDRAVRAEQRIER